MCSHDPAVAAASYALDVAHSWAVAVPMQQATSSGSSPAARMAPAPAIIGGSGPLRP